VENVVNFKYKDDVKEQLKSLKIGMDYYE